MPQNDAIARPYARAAFELAQEAGQLADWSAFLHTAGQAAAMPRVQELLDVPGADRTRVADAIAEVCASDPALAGFMRGVEPRNLLRLLAENHRLTMLADIAAGFEQLRAEVENTMDVVLTAATPVDDSQQARMAAALRQRFGREVRLRFVLDENLIGGARLQADDHVIDGTVRTRLAKLASALVH